MAAHSQERKTVECKSIQPSVLMGARIHFPLNLFIATVFKGREAGVKLSSYQKKRTGAKVIVLSDFDITPADLE
jgi:hypothetical protein